jgi:hypothetical protein
LDVCAEEKLIGRTLTINENSSFFIAFDRALSGAAQPLR